jgi:hypothetical protein
MFKMIFGKCSACVAGTVVSPHRIWDVLREQKYNFFSNLLRQSSIALLHILANKNIII